MKPWLLVLFLCTLRLQNLQLGLSDVGVEMQETKFKEHKALWKLNKRGVEGENIIHLLLNRYVPSYSNHSQIC